MRKYAGFYGNWDSGKRWYRFQKLERAVLAFGAEPGGHRAAADAFACRAVVLGMAATPPPMPASRRESAALDAERPWHVPAEQDAAIPGTDRGATPTQSRSPATATSRCVHALGARRARVRGAARRDSGRAARASRRLRGVVSARGRCALRRLGMGSARAGCA